MGEHIGHKIDATLIAGAVTAPAWLDWLHLYGGAVMVAGGLVLLGLRIMIAWKEYRK